MFPQMAGMLLKTLNQHKDRSISKLWTVKIKDTLTCILLAPNWAIISKIGIY